MKNFRQKKIIAFLLIFTILFCFPCKTFALTKENSTNNKSNNRSNNYPIIMVHGLFGWGNDELMGFNYWGGKSSLRQKLLDRGYTVFTPTIGPVSSNWDRACELYAYIVGGTVDYGKAHSERHGHARYGRTYPGVCPGLLTSGNSQKIHLIGHSMGGQTVRTLVQLLENGDQKELESNAENLSPLFKGGNHCVCSVTTIATPHDGSQVAHQKCNLEPFVHDIIAGVAAQTGTNISDNYEGLDFQLDQWGLKREKGESYKSYYNRVMNSNIWKETKDLSVWDLSPEGARDLNTWVKTQDDVYYFSIACEDTHKDLLTHHEVPNPGIDPILIKSGYIMGSYTNNNPGDVPIDSSWWQNDGIVSVISAISPKIGSTDKTNMNYANIDYIGNAEKGIWNYLELIKSVDHINVVGMNKHRRTVEPRFYNLAKMLTNLPK